MQEVAQHKLHDFADICVPVEKSSGTDPPVRDSPRNPKYFVGTSIFPSQWKLTIDAAVALARAHCMAATANGKADLPWPVIWLKDNLSITFANGDDHLEKPGGEFVIQSLLSPEEVEEFVKKTCNYPVNSGHVPAAH